jgi:hypothetical protein
LIAVYSRLIELRKRFVRKSKARDVQSGRITWATIACKMPSNHFCGDFWLNKSEACLPDFNSAQLDCDTKMIRWQI